MRGTHSLILFVPVPCGVHPRACGELRYAFLWLSANSGSSPRMRGTRPGLRHGLERARFIPAHAGNSPPQVTRRTLPPVHPRACGELDCKHFEDRVDSGSSPRMRGTHRQHERRSALVRFIPAHAGNSLPLFSSSILTAVHPRACGELHAPPGRAVPRYGSSPRMRGTLSLNLSVLIVNRFIPAHAGNSAMTVAYSSLVPVHPRACGELSVHPPKSICYTGSSPRMRGTRAFSQ